MHRCYIIFSLASGVFSKIGRNKRLYEAVGCLWFTSIKQTMPAKLQTNFRSQA